jgi:hypothetical protein
MMNQQSTVPLTVCIPCFKGAERLVLTLEKLAACQPAPAEILIHCDGGWQPDPGPWLSAVGSIPLRILYSQVQVGPGGGRDACIQAAAHELVASFDDDSWPLDKDYFGVAVAIMRAYPQSAMLSPVVYLEEKPVRVREPLLTTSRYYQGSASVHRRSHHRQLPGLVPIPAAYGAEEADLSLQAHAAGFGILECHWMRAWHDRPLADHQHQTLPWIQNEVLLGYLRYPLVAQPWAWWRALRQLAAMRGQLKKRQGLQSLLAVRTHCHRFRAYRHRYSLRQIWTHARIQPQVLPFDFSAVG